tara:strand:- start:135 stop:398 length:264 start_codon:yes stop_codon:yes gene_type:complete
LKKRLNFIPVPGHRGALPLAVKGAPNGTTSKNVHGKVEGHLDFQLFSGTHDRRVLPESGLRPSSDGMLGAVSRRAAPFTLGFACRAA